MSAMTNALEIGRLLADAAMVVWKHIRDGRPERVEEILPATLKVTLAKAVADAKAEAKFHGEQP